MSSALQKLPQFPRPTHDVVVRYWPTSEFEQNTIGYDEGEHRELEEAAVLRDAISDLPVTWLEKNESRWHTKKPPETEFQRYIRLTKDGRNGLWVDIDVSSVPVSRDVEQGFEKSPIFLVGFVANAATMW
ncbi:hypothetical protein RHSIM_Rhsim13G0147600 [Rhododendron simsii]|uniref:Uncharacterized protein n=1 Tax=Rhododendron simsii TaxID=118357 RepID=A0A834L6M6_RHOSS|nr:hypothetical protein RHSIM_Rhsim13G0147600 [Rhododendron simsii]